MDVQHQEYGGSLLMSSMLDTIDKVRCYAIGHDRDAGRMDPPKRVILELFQPAGCVPKSQAVERLLWRCASLVQPTRECVQP